jgi:DNA-directed RNA polymerase specialized sigma24 family protein
LNYNKAYRYALNLCRNRELAEDLTQEAWLRTTLNKPTNPNAVFTETIKNLYFNHRKRVNVRARNGVDIRNMMETQAKRELSNRDAQLDVIKLCTLLEKSYTNKSSRTNIRVFLAELDNDDRRQAAKDAGLSYNNYRMTLTRLRKTLREMYGPLS